MEPQKKKHLVQGAIMGAILGAAVSGIIWFMTNNIILTVAIIPVAALLGGAQLYLTSNRE